MNMYSKVHFRHSFTVFNKITLYKGGATGAFQHFDSLCFFKGTVILNFNSHYFHTKLSYWYFIIQNTKSQYYINTSAQKDSSGLQV